MIGFDKRRGEFDDPCNSALLSIQTDLSEKQIRRLKNIRQAWNFYEGYHWQDVPAQDSPEITVNYCRAFVDKFVAFELGDSFSITTAKKMGDIKITKEGHTLFEYLSYVWKKNSQVLFCTELGQMKSITGEAWIQVRYYPAEELLDDPFNEFPDGRIKLSVLPTSMVFPEYDPHQRGVLTKLTIMYTYKKKVKFGILGKSREEETIYKQIWTAQDCTIIDGKSEPEVIPNRYGVIPFVQIKNLVLAGKNEGRGDLEDIIPMNMEYNMKKSDVSEIIDYHAAPVTIVYGAKVGNLEKGANKMWGGLSKDARVENLELRGDLGASSSYIESTKVSMCEVGGIPETVLGGSQAISNTSGVALQYINLPLIEKTKLKRASTEEGLETVNKLIVLVSLFEGLIRKPKSVNIQDMFYNEVKIPDTLPKDTLLELQQIQQEMKMGLESRRGAMKRLGKENIEEKIKEIDKDMTENPCIYGHIDPNDTKHSPQASQGEDGQKLNSGFTNGQTAVEQVRTELTGKNGGGDIS